MNSFEIITDFDDPMIYINYQKLLGNVMRQSDTAWKIIRFFEEAKKNHLVLTSELKRIIVVYLSV